MLRPGGASFSQLDQPPAAAPTINAPAAMLVMVIFSIAIVSALMFKNSDWYLAHAGAWPRDVRWLVQPVIWLLAVVGGWFVVRSIPVNQPAPTLGLGISERRTVLGLGLGFACTFPMMALGMLAPLRDINRDLLYTTLVAGLSEELLFRAFAFGLLVQIARMRIWPAAILTGLVFGLVHLMHASIRQEPLPDQIGWIGMIALGGVLYAWIYARSGWNLWLVVAIHASMNLWWGVFDLSDTPLGTMGATLVRVLSVAIAIVVTLRMGTLLGARPGRGPTTISQ